MLSRALPPLRTHAPSSLMMVARHMSLLSSASCPPACRCNKHMRSTKFQQRKYTTSSSSSSSSSSSTTLFGVSLLIGGGASFYLLSRDAASAELQAEPVKPLSVVPAASMSIAPIVGKDVRDAKWWKRVLSFFLDQIFSAILPQVVFTLVPPLNFLSTPLYTTALSLLVEFVCMRQWGRTLGDKVMGVRTVQQDGSDKQLSYKQAGILALFRPLHPMLPLFLLAKWLPERNYLHNHLSGTIVIEEVNDDDE